MVDIKPMSSQDDILQEANAAQPSQDALQQPTHDTTPSADEVVPVNVIPTPSSQPQPITQKPVYPEPVPPAERAEEQKRNIAQAAGYTYRLPRGVYILVFLYAQVVAAYAFVYIYGLLSGTSNLFASAPVQGYPEFLTPLIATMLIAFMLSGHNMLRIGAVVLSAGTGVYMAVILGRTVNVLVQLGTLLFGGATYMIIGLIALPILVLLFTATYLLKSDVARAYN